MCNFGPTTYDSEYRVGAPRGRWLLVHLHKSLYPRFLCAPLDCPAAAGLWAPVLDTGALVRDVLPRLLAAVGGAADGASSAAELDKSRSELAAALARALVGISVEPGDPPIFAKALSAAAGLVAAAQADFRAPALPAAAAVVAGQPLLPTWLWGAPVNAPRGCYDAGPGGLPYSIAVPRLEPLTARLYVRLSGCDALLPL